MVNTSKIFINDSTVVTPYAILLFGGPIDVQHLQGTISVDKWIEFSAPARVAVLIKGLRGYMDRLLLEKFNRPEESIVNDPVMEGICKLLTTNGIWRVSNKKAIVHNTNNYHNYSTRSHEPKMQLDGTDGNSHVHFRIDQISLSDDSL